LIGPRLAASPWTVRTHRTATRSARVYESYLIDPAGEPDPEKWETEVAIRLADRQASR